MSAAADAAPLAGRRERGMARWRARSRLIRRLRLILPAAMGAILALLTGWVVVGGFLARITEARPAGQALIHMSNARFFGRDSAERPYVLAAAEAERDDSDLKRVTLIRPALTLDSGSAQAARISADQGVYREDDKMVRLQGHVTLQTASNTIFRTDRAIADTVKGMITGASPVYGSGPTGDISAQRFAVYDRGARVVFSGEVHSRMKRD